MTFFKFARSHLFKTEVWPFTAVCWPGRQRWSWDVFEKLPWRGEAVPRVALDATSVVLYDARACGLALGT